MARCSLCLFPTVMLSLQNIWNIVHESQTTFMVFFVLFVSFLELHSPSNHSFIVWKRAARTFSNNFLIYWKINLIVWNNMRVSIWRVYTFWVNCSFMIKWHEVMCRTLKPGIHYTTFWAWFLWRSAFILREIGARSCGWLSYSVRSYSDENTDAWEVISRLQHISLCDLQSKLCFD